jgi:hypothetical protein
MKEGVEGGEEDYRWNTKDKEEEGEERKERNGRERS